MFPLALPIDMVCVHYHYKVELVQHSSVRLMLRDPHTRPQDNMNWYGIYKSRTTNFCHSSKNTACFFVHIQALSPISPFAVVCVCARIVIFVQYSYLMLRMIALTLLLSIFFWRRQRQCVQGPMVLNGCAIRILQRRVPFHPLCGGYGMLEDMLAIHTALL